MQCGFFGKTNSWMKKRFKHSWFWHSGCPTGLAEARQRGMLLVAQKPSAAADYPIDLQKAAQFPVFVRMKALTTFVFVVAAGLLVVCGCKTTNLSPGTNADFSAQTIRPGAVWPDDRGWHIQAHGAGILKLGDIYYLFGEDRTRTNNPEKRYLACYSSRDLSHWHFCRQVVQLADPEHIGTGWVLERPKVYYNALTKKFVMYAHLDNSVYSLARVAVFECDQVDGDYHYLKSFRPLGHESRDLGQFVDDDGTAYLLSEDRPNGFRIYQLSEDYLSIAKDVCLIPEHLEGLALVHYGGLYYVVGSHLTGWDTNPNVYATASSLAGPWSAFADIAPPEMKTYGSQSGFLLKVCGTEATNVIFIADIWKPDAQWDSRYLWMPLQIGDGKLWLPKPCDWTINIRTGEFTLLKTIPRSSTTPEEPR